MGHKSRRSLFSLSGPEIPTEAPRFRNTRTVKKIKTPDSAKFTALTEDRFYSY